MTPNHSAVDVTFARSQIQQARIIGSLLYLVSFSVHTECNQIRGIKDRESIVSSSVHEKFMIA